MATKTSRIRRNLNFLGETAFLGGIFCLEYPNRRSEKVNCHFLNYRLSFRKLQIVISQTADFHFANYRFSFRKLQIFISFRFAPFRFANYSKPILYQWPRILSMKSCRNFLTVFHSMELFKAPLAI